MVRDLDFFFKDGLGFFQTVGSFDHRIMFVDLLFQFFQAVDIIGMTTSEKVWRKLNLSWGVTPVLCEEFSSMEVMFYHAMKKAKEVFSLQSGDAVVLTGGLINGKVGNTNVIKVETVK